MRIIYLTYNMNPRNGWGRYASDLIKGVKNAGHEVVILKEIDDGYEGFPVLRRGISIFITALKIRRYIKDCDVIHALDGYPYAVIAALANIGLNRKFIITGVGTYAVSPLYRWKWASLLRWAYRRANLVIAISSYTKEAIINKITLPKISVINPGIDLGKFYKSRQFSGEKFILSVGDLKFRKGYHISILAFALFRKKFPNFRYVIVGNQADAGYFNSLKSIANNLNINSSVQFLSDVSEKDLSNLYSRASVFILTSVNQGHHFEGFGLVFLEAAAAGLPVIGTTGNGIEDAVKDGFNGMLVHQNDIEKTANALIKILGDTNLQEYYSRNGYDWAQEHSLDKMAGEYLQVYGRLLSGGPEN